MSPKSNDWYLFKRRENTGTRGRSHVNKETEIGEMQPEAREGRGSPEGSTNWKEAKKESPLESSEGVSSS